ncbi:HNH endonuclease [Streptomyces sp. YC504]|uniref:HNH endonuclease n=1 Tax=Streptomyces mesophilus TaxID=1775132 RepID=A0A6G4XKL7_9ACTN|nr:HNH endonuclease [Streptomyces mesophilus]NGO77254.1 HNH endonuclease [Streptomyces mesophilus]
MRSPAWTQDELILACALVASNEWREYRTADPQVQDLSNLLRSLPLHPQEARTLPQFRSPDSVSRKTADIASNHPDYTGKPTRCGEPTRRMIAAFVAHEAEMLAVARAIEEGIGSGELHRIEPQPDEADDEGNTALEGRLLARWVIARERNPRLRHRKIDQARSVGAPLECAVCGFDFERVYGPRGAGYVEVHHVLPLHISGPRETKLDDLAFLCANCHRMCHRTRSGRSWLTPEALQTEMRSFRRKQPSGAVSSL